ncbi:hypothetical protein [Nodosilinea nodulosa]|uniref:hypothetical protein n=1 Tax=Nodosilinea nodulosa TaxID=416001 RepID=UPI00036B04B6|nr:hypothetical protein [Nodosilinea nodulosa]
MAGTHKRTNDNRKRTERLRKLDVDKILELLPEDVEAEFKRYARFNQHSRDLQGWLKEAQDQYASHFPETWKPFVPSIASVTNWVRKNYPTGEQAVVLNELTSAYVGLDYDQVIESSLAQSVTLCMTLVERLRLEGVNEIDPAVVLQQVASFQKTISILYKDLNKAKRMSSMRDAEMSGAQRVIDLLLNQFKDQAGESAIKEACIGALEQIESEIYGAV